MAATIFPTGTTIYDPEQCWNGYTVFQPSNSIGAMLVDMNGKTVHQWKNLLGFPGSNKILPGGYVMGSTHNRNPKYGMQDNVDLVQLDWDGNIVWKFEKYELVKDPRQKKTWMVRQHHDFQRDGNPVGYFAPGLEPEVDRGNTLILCHKNLKNPAITEKLLLDDVVIEVTWEGKIVWEWVCSEHFEEFGFDEEARNVLARSPGAMGGERGIDWMHVNSVSKLGPNKWHDASDSRFHPENLIWDSRESNILAIIDKQTGKTAWQVGPDYMHNPALRKMGQIIGQHHVHMIPRGLPGEGNILVFDNGGRAGYGAPNPGAPTGKGNALRDYSRIVEFNPVTLEVVWQYPPQQGEMAMHTSGNKFYSSFMSSAQRLPNGNTIIAEGSSGRLFEVTAKHETVWEFINPYYAKTRQLNMIYRAYRVPYAWVPQLEPPKEKGIPAFENARLRVPGSSQDKELKVAGKRR